MCFASVPVERRAEKREERKYQIGKCCYAEKVPYLSGWLCSDAEGGAD